MSEEVKFTPEPSLMNETEPFVTQQEVLDILIKIDKKFDQERLNMLNLMKTQFSKRMREAARTWYPQIDISPELELNKLEGVEPIFKMWIKKQGFTREGNEIKVETNLVFELRHQRLCELLDLPI